MNIRDAIKVLANTGDEVYSQVCEVLSVTGNMCDVRPINGDADILDVRLSASESDTALIAIPSVGSMVVVTFINSSTAYVAMCSDIDSVSIRGDQYGGVVNAIELKKQLDVVTQRIDTLYRAINNAVPAVGSADGGASFQAQMKAIMSAQVLVENFDSIENEKVKHG